MMAHDGLSENGMPKNVMVDDHFPHKNGNEFGISSIFGHTQMFTISPIIFWVYPPTLSTRLYTTDRPAATHLFGFVHIGEAALAILLHPRRRVGKKEPCLLLGNDDKSLDLGTMGYLFKKRRCLIDKVLSMDFHWLKNLGNQDMFTNISRMGYLNLPSENFSRCTKSMGCSHRWDFFSLLSLWQGCHFFETAHRCFKCGFFSIFETTHRRIIRHWPTDKPFTF